MQIDCFWLFYLSDFDFCVFFVEAAVVFHFYSTRGRWKKAI